MGAKKMVVGLTTRQIESMRAVARGADVFDRAIAVDLRAVHGAFPGLINITGAMGFYGPRERHPYFGAILTAAGRAAISKAEGK